METTLKSTKKYFIILHKFSVRLHLFELPNTHPKRHGHFKLYSYTERTEIGENKGIFYIKQVFEKYDFVFCCNSKTNNCINI